MPYSSRRWPAISRVLIPRAYIETILSSKPGNRRWYLAISCGSKVDRRSRGTSRSIWPVSVSTVFLPYPLRLLPSSSPPRWWSISAFNARSASAFFSPSSRPFGSKAVFGSAPASSWSRIASGIRGSLRLGMSGLLRSSHARPHTKFPTGPVRPLELGPGPELDRRQPQRQPVRRHGQAGVHQQGADGVHLEPSVGAPPARGRRDRADPLGSRTPVGELGRVLQDQDRPVGGRDAAAGRAEMAGEDLGLADRLVREEAVGGLGIGPILTGQGDGRADRACHPREELAQPPAQTFVLERRARELLVYPGSGIPAGTIHRAPGLCVSVPDNGSRPGRSAQAQGCIPQMWVIGSV